MEWSVKPLERRLQLVVPHQQTWRRLLQLRCQLLTTTLTTTQKEVDTTHKEGRTEFQKRLTVPEPSLLHKVTWRNQRSLMTTQLVTTVKELQRQEFSLRGTQQLQERVFLLWRCTWRLSEHPSPTLLHPHEVTQQLVRPSLVWTTHTVQLVLLSRLKQPMECLRTHQGKRRHTARRPLLLETEHERTLKEFQQH